MGGGPFEETHSSVRLVEFKGQRAGASGGAGASRGRGGLSRLWGWRVPSPAQPGPPRCPPSIAPTKPPLPPADGLRTAGEEEGGSAPSRRHPGGGRMDFGVLGPPPCPQRQCPVWDQPAGPPSATSPPPMLAGATCSPHGVLTGEERKRESL